MEGKKISQTSGLIFNKFDHVTLIGGGLLMDQFNDFLNSIDIHTSIILAERHANEYVGNINFYQHYLNKKNNVYVLKNIDVDFLNKNLIKSDNRICICFGPHWIFDNEIINFFDGLIFNFNGIPIPEFQGGAHYTWQILNDNKVMGANIQVINENIDRGDIIFSKTSDIGSLEQLKPSDFFNLNNDFGLEFLKDFILMALNSYEFSRTNYDDLINERIYFPRLNSYIHGWIDWCWSSDNIIKFCNSFDDPYSGAKTLLKNEEVVIRSINLHKCKKFHPFTQGLIINKYKNKIFVAVKDGILEISEVLDKNKILIINKCKLGNRFFTPRSILDRALTFEFKP